MAWPPATYDVISRNHSDISQITQIISTVWTTEIELLISTPRKIKNFRAVEWLGMGGFVSSLFLFSVIQLLNYLLIYFINSFIYSIIFFFTCIHTDFELDGELNRKL